MIKYSGHTLILSLIFWIRKNQVDLFDFYLIFIWFFFNYFSDLDFDLKDLPIVLNVLRQIKNNNSSFFLAQRNLA